MKNKAFTLLELLGVVIILGVLSLITFPIILNQIKNAKQGIKDSTKTLIIDAAKDYYEDNTNNFDLIEGMTYCIDIKTLTDENYLNKNLKNENLNNIDTSKKVKLIYHNEKFNYDVVDSCTYYTVTFDANGGSVDIDSKEVIENSAYGTLPTPTREGYTFMGWNGKNMFDFDNVSVWNNATTKELINNEKVFIRNSSYYNDNIWPIFRTETMNLEEDKVYTLSTYIWSDEEINFDQTKKLYINSATSTQHNLGKIDKIKQILYGTFTYSGQADIVHIYPRVPENCGIYISNVQIEEGNTATEYEPYYITSDTKVTRNYDHTLKAIWKENE